MHTREHVASHAHIHDRGGRELVRAGCGRREPWLPAQLSPGPEVCGPRIWALRSFQKADSAQRSKISAFSLPLETLRAGETSLLESGEPLRAKQYQVLPRAFQGKVR